jgi:3-deoxy-D-manno-octulosonic-acid transferase
LLLAKEAAIAVADAQALGDWLIRLLGDAAERARIGENGRRAVEQNRGALAQVIALVDGRLPALEQA